MIGLRLIATVAVLLHIWCLAGLCAEFCLRDSPDNSIEGLLARLPSSVYSSNKALDLDLCSIFKAYPKNCLGIEIDGANRVFLLLTNRTRIIYDDGLIKTFDEKLQTPDLQDMLEQPYPCRYPLQRSPINLDPGRFRVESFFKSIYGHSPADVQKKLTSVRLGQTTFQISTCGNVHESLQTIFQQIEALLEKRPDLRSYISPSGGSFKWRTIAGTTRLSPHAFGIAVDINPRLGPYWRWGSPDEKWLNNKKFLFPMEIVDIFEQNGFIWGGRWYHYDFMHFEFRPELFLKSLYRAES